MNELLGLARVAWSERLAWTILHSLWQIAALTAVFAVASFWLRRSSPGARYALGCLTLLAMVVSPLATLVSLGDAPGPAAAVVVAAVAPLPTTQAGETLPPPADAAHEATDSSAAAPGASAEAASTEPTWTIGTWTMRAGGLPIGRFLPWISAGWMLGVVLFSLRPLLGLLTVRRLRSRGLSSPPADLNRVAENLVARFNLRQPVRFAQSALVEVPSVVGYLRPIVLLPASVISGLDPEQIELILAHELAHVRRHDYLVNVLQTGVEALLFYHPGTWWVSARVRAERENCCDDMAVEICGSRDAYVGALLALEEQRASGPLALAASGGSLLARARRLISPPASQAGLGRATAWLAAVLPLGAVVLLLLLGTTFAADSGGKQGETRAEEPAAAPADQPAAGGQADSKPAEPKSNAGETKSAGASAAATDSPKIAFEVALEDDAKAKLKVVLLDQYLRELKTWENVEPGEVRLDLPDVDDDRYRLEVSAEGFSSPRASLDISREGIDVQPKRIELFRRRYVLMRYVVNSAGKQELEGRDVKEGRVAVLSGPVPDLRGDWSIIQQRGVPTFQFHMIGVDNGFASAPAGATFEDLTRAPDPDQYQPARIVPVEKGAILFNRIIGGNPQDRKYAKILIEEITETRPADVEIIDTSVTRANAAARPANKDRQPPGKVVGGLVRPAVASTNKNEQPAGDGASRKPRRYVVLRYAVNMSGNQELEGPDVKEGRVAIASGNAPDLRGDWVIVQPNGVPMFRIHRMSPGNGFALGPPNASFEAVKRAPNPDQYQTENQPIPADKGILFFSHILGNTNDPNVRRYAKLLIEDITETPPPGMEAIDTSPAAANSAGNPANTAEPPAADGTSGELAVTVDMEGDAVAPVRLELREMGNSSRRWPLKIWDRPQPGTIKVQLPQLNQGPFALTAVAEGYAPVRTLLRISGTGPNPAEMNVKLHRTRYVVLRYAMNTQGKHNLTGENVKQGRIGILIGGVPELGGWIVDQVDGQPTLKIMVIARNSGFALAHEGDKFDDLDQAPANQDYTPAGLPLKQGMILFNRVLGGRPEDQRYAKLLVEEISEQRPENLEIVHSPGMAGLGR